MANKNRKNGYSFVSWHFPCSVFPDLTQGPQKIFGEPHAARGLHFGHPCYTLSLCAIKRKSSVAKATHTIMLIKLTPGVSVVWRHKEVIISLNEEVPDCRLRSQLRQGRAHAHKVLLAGIRAAANVKEKQWIVWRKEKLFTILLLQFFLLWCFVFIQNSLELKNFVTDQRGFFSASSSMCEKLSANEKNIFLA